MICVSLGSSRCGSLIWVLCPLFQSTSLRPRTHSPPATGSSFRGSQLTDDASYSNHTQTTAYYVGATAGDKIAAEYGLDGADVKGAWGTRNFWKSCVSLGEDRSWDGTVTDTNVLKSPSLLKIFEKGVWFRGRQYKIGSAKFTMGPIVFSGTNHRFSRFVD